jgi:hypothetical protein
MAQASSSGERQNLQGRSGICVRTTCANGVVLLAFCTIENRGYWSDSGRTEGVVPLLGLSGSVQFAGRERPAPEQQM